VGVGVEMGKHPHCGYNLAFLESLELDNVTSNGYETKVVLDLDAIEVTNMLQLLHCKNLRCLEQPVEAQAAEKEEQQRCQRTKLKRKE